MPPSDERRRILGESLPFRQAGGWHAGPGEDILPMVSQAVEGKYRVNLIVNNRLGGDARLIAQMIAGKLHGEKLLRII